MKKFFKFAISFLILSGIFTLNSFADNSNDWINVNNYETRKTYSVDEGETSYYMVHAIDKITESTENDSRPTLVKAYNMGVINSNSSSEEATKTVTKEAFAEMIYNAALKFKPETANEGYNPLTFCVSRDIMNVSDIYNRAADVTLEEAIDYFSRFIYASPDYKVVISKEKVDTYYLDATAQKRAYLTFDDGASAVSLSILKTLKENNIKATFFITGQGNPDIVKQIYDEGHAIGNHSSSHLYSYIYSSTDAFWEDFNKQQEFLKEVTGEYPTILRFPGGSNNTVSNKYNNGIMNILTKDVTEKGYTYFDWNVSGQDAVSSTPTPASKIVSSVVEGAKNKDNIIILLHHTGVKSTTAEALPAIIEALKAEGYTFLPLSEYSFNNQFLKP